MYKKEFQFGSKITSHDYFSFEKGYGFIHPEHLNGNTLSEQALYAGGWNLQDDYKTDYEIAMATNATGVSLIKPDFVAIFKISVPDYGSYHVTLKSTASENVINNMTIWAGRRNLVARNVCIEKGKTYTKQFFSYVSPYIPAMTSKPCTEKAIYISITGKNATLSELIIEQKETLSVFVAGDSTLTDQNALSPFFAGRSCTGWAQNLLSFYENVAICNQAHSGMTTNCFRDDGHWNILKEQIKPSDIVILQFGHNDQKRRNLRPFEGYLNNLRWYCSEIKALKATPIIVSPISRIPIKEEDSYYSLLEDYALACKKAAKECEVPFIDLHSITFHFWCEHHHISSDYFMPGDITHTNDYGAELIVKFFVSELLRQNIQPLSNLLINLDKTVIQPQAECIPAMRSSSCMPQIEIPYLDISDVPEYEDLKSALHKGLLDPCVMYLHPNSSMPRAQFLMVYLKALRLAGTRPYIGYFCDISHDEWDAGYVQTCINENLIDLGTAQNHYFRPNDNLTFSEYASFLVRSLENEKSLRSQLSLTVCFQKAKALHLIPIDCNANDAITRASCYQGLVKLMDLLDTALLALPSDAEIHPVG